LVGVRQHINLNYPDSTGTCLYPAEVLIRHGLLSNAPEHPTWAVSLLTLDLYHSQRLVKPNFGIQPFIQSLCIRAHRFYFANLSVKFSQAYDIYLAIKRRVDDRIMCVLGREDPSFRIKHFCPACTHKKEGETETLRYKILYSIDGGTSLKRFKDAGAASKEHHFQSSFLLSRDTVENWKHVIKKTVQKRKKGRTSRLQADQGEFMYMIGLYITNLKNLTASDEEDNSDDPDVAIELGERIEAITDGELVITKNVQGDPTDASDSMASCVEKWKANADDAKKGMFSCFKETGIFIAVCRHGLLITACDMVESGELSVRFSPYHDWSILSIQRIRKSDFSGIKGIRFHERHVDPFH
jgi:hypothetical protein